MASVVQFWVGSGCSSAVALNMFTVATPTPSPSSSSCGWSELIPMVLHRDQSWDRSCSCCTQPPSATHWVTTCVHTHLPMTCRSTVFANRLVFRRSRNRCLRALTMSTCGWLQLNTNKTEVLWCSAGRRQHQIPKIPTRVGDLVVPAIFVRDLGIYLDANATMRTHVSRTAKTLLLEQSFPNSSGRVWHFFSVVLLERPYGFFCFSLCPSVSFWHCATLISSLNK